MGLSQGSIPSKALAVGWRTSSTTVLSASPTSIGRSHAASPPPHFSPLFLPSSLKSVQSRRLDASVRGGGVTTTDGENSSSVTTNDVDIGGNKGKYQSGVHACEKSRKSKAKEE